MEWKVETIISLYRFVAHIYSNKRRIWDKKVNKRHGPDAVLIRGTPYNLRPL